MINRRAISAVFFDSRGRNRRVPRVRIPDRFRGDRKIGPPAGFMGTRAHGNPVLQIDAIIQETDRKDDTQGISYV